MSTSPDRRPADVNQRPELRLDCLGCALPQVSELVDFGPQPPSNRFLQSAGLVEDTHRLHLGQCRECGLVQLIDPMPTEMVKSRFAWLSYNEPEGHLDALVERLTKLPGISKASRIHGLTYKDDSTLARFNRLGYSSTFRFAPANDLGLDDPLAGLESVQSAVTEQRSAALAGKYPPADVLLVRHVLEHAHDPARFLRALAPLVSPSGYVVFEVPDCVKFMHACDYSFVWEEHICYFSEATLRSFITTHGFGVFETLTSPYPLEDSLIAIVQPTAASRQHAAVTGSDVEQELQRGRRFAEGFPDLRARYRRDFAALRASGKRAAVFGAGHLAAKFLNLLDLGDYVNCVIDDNPNKMGLLMPGSKLPVVGSAALAERSIDVCLLSLSPESEQKVVSKKKDYVDAGGKFRSIFALSPLAGLGSDGHRA